LRRWNAPVDGGRTRGGQPWLGPHKTWRGFVAGMVIATITLWLQQQLVADSSWLEQITETIDYTTLPILILGPLLGLGALGGDALKSYFKRRLNRTSGSSWLPFDQLDYIIGAIVVSLPFALLSVTQYAWAAAIYFALHLAVSYAGYLVGLKQQPV
jgi:CDP-2,3-bis-(O-geranylgeranyl)-sn-glycerol synthase